MGSGEVDLTRPPGDDGLFGPGSAPWRIHGDFSSMIIGGVSALLLQIQHAVKVLAGDSEPGLEQLSKGRHDRDRRPLS